MRIQSFWAPLLGLAPYHRSTGGLNFSISVKPEHGRDRSGGGAGRRSIKSASLRIAPSKAARVSVKMSFDRALDVPPDRLVVMTVEDSKPLLGIGWETVSR